MKTAEESKKTIGVHENEIFARLPPVSYTIPTSRLSPSRLLFSDIDKILGDERTKVYSFPISDVLALETSETGGVPPIPRTNVIRYLSLNNPLREKVQVFAAEKRNSEFFIFMDVNGSRRKVSVDDVQRAINLINPDVVCVPSERLPDDASAGNNREKRAVLSSMFFLDELLKKRETSETFPVLAANVPAGISDEKSTEAFLSACLSKTNSVYWSNMENGAPALNSSFLMDICPVKGSFWRIAHLLMDEERLLKTRKILIETSWPFDLAEDGILLTNNFPWESEHHHSKTKRRKSRDASEMFENESFLNLEAPGFFDDETPLLSEASESFKSAPEYVKSSARHSRSYVHHLLKKNELLGFQLVATMNLYLYDLVIRKISMSIENGEEKELEWLKMFEEIDEERKEPKERRANIRKKSE